MSDIEVIQGNMQMLTYDIEDFNATQGKTIATPHQ